MPKYLDFVQLLWPELFLIRQLCVPNLKFFTVNKCIFSDLRRRGISDIHSFILHSKVVKVHFTQAKASAVLVVATKQRHNKSSHRVAWRPARHCTGSTSKTRLYYKIIWMVNWEFEVIFITSTTWCCGILYWLFRLQQLALMIGDPIN